MLQLRHKILSFKRFTKAIQLMDFWMASKLILALKAILGNPEKGRNYLDRQTSPVSKVAKAHRVLKIRF